MFTLLTCVTLAASALGIALRPDSVNATLAKKDFEDARFTWFDVGQGACGGYNYAYEHVVALNEAQWDGGANCWRTINIQSGGQTTQAAIVDLCPSCPYAGLDLSTGLFDFFTWDGAAGSLTDPGVIDGSWDFA